MRTAAVLSVTLLLGMATYAVTHRRACDRARVDAYRINVRHHAGSVRHYDIEVRGRVNDVTPTCECVHVSETSAPPWTEGGEEWSRFRVVLETRRSNGNSGVLVRLATAQPLLVTLD